MIQNYITALLLAAESVQAGDDTPVMLYAIIGIVALILVIVSVALGFKSKK